MNNDVGRAKASMVMDALRPILGDDWEPELYEPGYHHPEAWVIASETGPQNWPQQATHLINRVAGNNLYVEAVNHWSIAIFPASDVSETMAAHRPPADAHPGTIRMGRADYRPSRKLN